MRKKLCLVKKSRLDPLFFTISMLLLAALVVPLPGVHAANSALQLISVANDGTQMGQYTASPSMSEDGRYVAFHSSGGIFVRDRDADGDGIFDETDAGATSTVRVDVASNGTPANHGSGGPSISADGRFVAFHSLDPDLAPGDNNGTPPPPFQNNLDVFVHDRDTDGDGIFDEAGAVSTVRVSVASDGTGGNEASHTASISADGKIVAFYSSANNLVLGVPGIEVYVHNRDVDNDGILDEPGAISTELVSAAYGLPSTAGNGGSYTPSVSADGRYIAFQSYSTDLVNPSLSPGTYQRVFVRDSLDSPYPTTQLISVASDGTPGDAYAWHPTISSDGRYIAFASTATNLVPDDNNGVMDVFVHDRQTGATVRVSVASDGTEGNDISTWPAISPDGRYVAFDSNATNLVAADTNNLNDVFLHDRVTHVTARISLAEDGSQVNAISGEAVVSGGGYYVAFRGMSDHMISGDTNGFDDIFVAVVDRDGDGIPDFLDTCPGDYNAIDDDFVFDRQRRDSDDDGKMDACDNCPSVYNPGQQDSDRNGIGEACEPYTMSTDLSPDPGNPPVVEPGEPIWDKICVKNTSDALITIVRPDCYNIHTRWRRSPDSPPVVPRDRHGKAYGIPADLVTLQPEGDPSNPAPDSSYCVYCDLSETVASAHLEGGDYLVDHTYTNWVQDPEFNFITGQCENAEDQINGCYPGVWIGWMSTGAPKTIQVQVPTTPVETLSAQCTFSPEVWLTQWASITTSKVITATLSLSGTSFAGLDNNSILLNGHTKPSYAAVDSSGNLILQFNRREAVNSLQSPVVAGRFFQTIQGTVSAGSFTAQSPILLLDALNVAIDIKPGSYPNSINLGSNGNVPVAILSNSSFDASTIDPTTVTLADAAVRVKGKKGELMASITDLNGDGLRDLLIHIDTTGFDLTSADVEAVLEGWTYDGETPVVGKDSVRIVP